MVTLYSDHPSHIPSKTRTQLRKLTFGKHRGLMYDYFDDYDGPNEKVYWIVKKGKIIAWAVRSLSCPYPSFMVYVSKQHRRQGWATVLYNEAFKSGNACKYAVYGSHSNAAEAFYEYLGRGDWN